MIRLPLRLLLIIGLCLLAAPLAAEELTGTVSWVYDGDTLQIKPIGKVRLIGIDTPENKDSKRDRYYLNNYHIPRKHLRQIARQAKNYNIKQVKNKPVRLIMDRQEKDQYGRLLVYLYLPDGRQLNRLLLEKGLASVFRRYQFSQKQDFLATEKIARQNQIGLWQQ